jgi:predicted nucleic acid-binding protein
MLLLDTDVMIDLLRQYPPAVSWLDSLGAEEIVLPGFVVMELMQGCRNKQEQEKMEVDLAAYSVAWPSPATCDGAISVFAQYHLSHSLAYWMRSLHKWLWLCMCLSIPSTKSII